MFIRAVLGEEKIGEIITEGKILEIDAEMAAEIIEELYQALWRLVEKGALTLQYEEREDMGYTELFHTFRIGHIKIEYTDSEGDTQTIRTLYIP